MARAQPEAKAYSRYQWRPNNWTQTAALAYQFRLPTRKPFKWRCDRCVAFSEFDGSGSQCIGFDLALRPADHAFEGDPLRQIPTQSPLGRGLGLQVSDRSSKFHADKVCMHYLEDPTCFGHLSLQICNTKRRFSQPCARFSRQSARSKTKRGRWCRL